MAERAAAAANEVRAAEKSVAAVNEIRAAERTAAAKPLNNTLDIEKAAYAQKDFGLTFGTGGPLERQSLASVVNKLYDGVMTPADLPVDIIRRGDNTLILNTRTSQTLEQAGIPRSQWTIIDRTGQASFEKRLTDQLRKNGLDEKGITTVKPRGR